MTPAEQHAHDAGRFTELVDSASGDDWERPSPVAGWTARDVVAHLVEWLPEFIERADVALPPVDVDADPAAAWRQRAADVQRLLEAEGGREFVSPRFGTLSLGRAIDQFYTGDVWMHSWDLARALGLEIDLGEQRCADALAGMEQIDELLRSSGQFGPRVDVPADASAQDRFIGFIGRDPFWEPPA
ncbi:MAG TPA: TIGR03086 family metal-binding protein [Nocardioides sp.]|nr:TIGR03086 family metal-binding protein [Nocardioides sp.]